MPNSEILRAFQQWLAAGCLVALGVLLLIAVAMYIAPLWRAAVARLRRLRPWERAALAAVSTVAIAYGGSKGVISGADPGIELVGIAVGYDSTNDVTFVEVGFVGNNVTVSTPVSVRNDQKEAWTELEKLDASVTVDLPTNILSFAVAGNVETNRFWWVGTETPAVIIETKGIEITRFVATSRAVEIEWTCDDENAVEFAVQRRPKGSSQWQTVGITQALGYVFVGFTVGETWEWRVMSTYEEGD